MFVPIKPRSFSIASSSRSGVLDVLVAVVEYKTVLKVTRKGLCSNWLKQLVVGDHIQMWLRKGTFMLPKDQVSHDVFFFNFKTAYCDQNQLFLLAWQFICMIQSKFSKRLHFLCHAYEFSEHATSNGRSGYGIGAIS